MKKYCGFSLIELVIVIAIIGIISGIGIPQYLDYTLRSHRADAHISLLALQLYLEEYYIDNQVYPTTLTASQKVSQNNYYTLSLSNPSGNQSFTLTATPKGTQTNDTDCAKITLTHTGLKSGENSSGTTHNACW